MEKVAEKSPEDIGFLMSFMRTYDALNRYLELRLMKWKTSPIRFAVLNAIVGHGGEMTPGEISRWTFRSPRTVTSMLDSLERDGLIRREANPKDRRSIWVVVTPKGLKHTERMALRSEAISQDALSGLEPDEIDKLDAIVRKWRKHLFAEIDKKDWKKAK
ncbi:MAG: MarR family transcriptional regulator [Chloroflexi bacterium]|nr:MarR family transcriptional regulator [Chloroflexota bacterium]